MIHTDITGFLILNKPKGISSFTCIRIIKRLIAQKIKIGHCGTLDNFASGLLIICIGRGATKQSENLLNLDKKYKVKAKLGELRDTLDYTGTIEAEKEICELSIENLIRATESLGKSYIQVPPIFSALKYNGTSLYKLARKNEDIKDLEQIVQSKKREVKLFDIKILDIDNPFFSFEAHVSKGTYIRSLSNDIAGKLENFATTYELERVAIGNIDISMATNLESITSLEALIENIIDVEKFKSIVSN